jgi:hypothetical protein
MGNAPAALLLPQVREHQSVAGAARRARRQECKLRSQNLRLEEALEDLTGSCGVTIATQSTVLDQTVARAQARGLRMAEIRAAMDDASAGVDGRMASTGTVREADEHELDTRNRNLALRQALTMTEAETAAALHWMSVRLDAAAALISKEVHVPAAVASAADAVEVDATGERLQVSVGVLVGATTFPVRVRCAGAHEWSVSRTAAQFEELSAIVHRPIGGGGGAQQQWNMLNLWMASLSRCEDDDIRAALHEFICYGEHIPCFDSVTGEPVNRAASKLMAQLDGEGAGHLRAARSTHGGDASPAAMFEKSVFRLPHKTCQEFVFPTPVFDLPLTLFPHAHPVVVCCFEPACEKCHVPAEGK